MIGRRVAEARNDARPPRLTEAQVQQQCVDFMRLDGWRPLRTDPCSDRRRGKGFGELGMADHLFIRYLDGGELPLAGAAQVLWVEFKRPPGFDFRGHQQKGTRAKLHQRLWHGAERATGALTIIAGDDFPPDFDGFVAWYRASGLLRREGL